MEVWSLAAAPLERDVAYPNLSRKRFQREVVRRMWAAPSGAAPPKFDPRRIVLLLGEDNHSKGPIAIADAISQDRPIIIDRLRPDLVCIDFDNVPRAEVRSFIELYLSDQNYVIVPSGGEATMAYRGSRCRLHRYHGFVISKSLDAAEAIRRAAKRLHREMRQVAKDERWEQEVWVSVRHAIRGPFFAHRYPERAEALREFSGDYPGVLSAIVEVFDTRCSWTAADLAAIEQTTRGSRLRIPQPGSSKLSRRESRQLLEILDDKRWLETGSGAPAAFALVNRLEARGFTAEQVWKHREHHSLEWLVRGPYQQPVSDEAGWGSLSRAFENAAETRLKFVPKDCAPLRVDLVRSAVLFLQGSHFKILMAGAVAERDGHMKRRRSAQVHKRVVGIGQSALGELAGISSSDTVNRTLAALEATGWIVQGPAQPIGTPHPFAITVPKTVQTKTKQYARAQRCNRQSQTRVAKSSSGIPTDRTKLKHTDHLPPYSSSEGNGSWADAVTARRTLRALLETRAFRARGLPPAALQVIVADLIGVAREDLPIGPRTRDRALAEMRRARLFDDQGSLAADVLPRLARLATKWGLVDAADRQRERNQRRRIGLQCQLAMAAPTPAARKRELRQLEQRNPTLGEAVRRELESIYGDEWFNA